MPVSVLMFLTLFIGVEDLQYQLFWNFQETVDRRNRCYIRIKAQMSRKYYKINLPIFFHLLLAMQGLILGQ